MKILILGGARFLGRHLATQAARRGHRVTLFADSSGDLELPTEVERVAGDRAAGLGPLGAREFDACIDADRGAAGPATIARNAAELGDRIGHATFVSGLSVYADLADEGQTEGSALGSCGLSRCEEAWREHFQGAVLVLRPAPLAGPGEGPYGLNYWAQRLAAGGEVLCPGPRDQRVQWTDVRDLAQWAIACIEKEERGCFNVGGPERGLPLAELLEQALRELRSDARLTWVDGSFLEERGVAPLGELPLWMPEEGPRGLLSTDVTKARSAGYRKRPLGDTLRAVQDGSRGRREPVHRGGLTPERERQLLAEWSELRSEARRPALAGREI